ncbi:MAG: urea ABC transporter ATP-binding subunit UrtE [Alphaproteobacteria bacterium]|jgi:urea transport system ATP-binding protein
MLEIDHLNSFYGGSHILHDLSFNVEKGTILAVIGRNGVGKTTLLKTIIGLTDSSTGSIKLNGEEIVDTPTFRRARMGIGYAPQGREIIPDFTIRENILMGGFARRNGSSRIPDVVPELFPYLMENLDRPGGLLSGGQQQQLAIARALASEPSLLLLDEPTEGIQPNIVEQIEETIQSLNQKLGLTIILVEQNLAFARSAAHAFVMMEKGQVVASGDTDALTDEVVAKHMTI